MEQIVNIGKNESRLRIGFGFFLIGMGGVTALPGWGSLAAFGLGASLIYMGIHHFCPLWKLLGIHLRPPPFEKSLTFQTKEVPND